MKKIFTTLLVSFVVLVGAQAQNLKIHFSDGTTKEFTVTSIDSITFVDPAPIGNSISISEADGNLHITPSGDFAFVFEAWSKADFDADFGGNAETALEDFIGELIAMEIFADESYTGEQIIPLSDYGPGTCIMIAAGVDESGNLITAVATHEFVGTATE